MSVFTLHESLRSPSSLFKCIGMCMCVHGYICVGVCGKREDKPEVSVPKMLSSYFEIKFLTGLDLTH